MGEFIPVVLVDRISHFPHSVHTHTHSSHRETIEQIQCGRETWREPIDQIYNSRFQFYE